MSLKLKIFHKNFNFGNLQRGMTYVELIVVMSIFAVISAVTLFNYGVFQAKVDLKNLGSDMALEIIRAQRDAMGGKLDALAPVGWKPTYGISFDTSLNNKRLVYFSDRNSDGLLTGGSCNGECLQSVDITRGNYISAMALNGTGTCPGALTKLDVTFIRPDSTAIIKTTPSEASCSISYAQLTLTSPNSTNVLIKIYPSGRVQLN